MLYNRRKYLIVINSFSLCIVFCYQFGLVAHHTFFEIPASLCTPTYSQSLSFLWATLWVPKCRFCIETSSLLPWHLSTSSTLNWFQLLCRWRYSLFNDRKSISNNHICSEPTWLTRVSPWSSNCTRIRNITHDLFLILINISIYFCCLIITLCHLGHDT